MDGERPNMADEGYTISVRMDQAALNILLRGLVINQRFYGLIRRLDDIAWVVVRSGTPELYRLDAKAIEPMSTESLTTEWTDCRLFNNSVEWRWQRQRDGRYSVLGLSEDPARLAGAGGKPRAWSAVNPGQRRATLLLAGSIDKEGGRWMETRLPKALFYPVRDRRSEQGKPRPPMMTYLEYRDKGSGFVQFLRLMELT